MQSNTFDITHSLVRIVKNREFLDPLCSSIPTPPETLQKQSSILKTSSMFKTCEFQEVPPFYLLDANLVTVANTSRAASRGVWQFRR